MSSSELPSACTIDVEDYFQVSAFETLIPRSTWDSTPLRLERGIDAVLSALEQAEVRGTFFVLGWIAERQPALIRRIAEAGHDLGCHSQWHRLVYSMTREEFRADLRESKDAIEQAAGVAVECFRAPSFSITRRSPFAPQVLVEEGFRIDSSIFPTRHDRYGIPDAPLAPFRIATPAGELIEFPMTSVGRFGARLPVGGGGYFRLYPYYLTRFLIRSVRAEGRPTCLYLHPWEFDPDQPRIAGASRWSTWRHRVGLSRTEARFRRLLADVPFATLADSLAHYRRQVGELPLWSLSD